MNFRLDTEVKIWSQAWIGPLEGPRPGRANRCKRRDEK